MSKQSAKTILSKNNLEEIIAYNNKVAKNNQITEFFTEKGYIENAKEVLDKKTFIKWLKSLNRKFITYEVDKEHFYSKNDIFIFRDSLFITDWEKEVCVEIKQIETINILKQFFELLKNSSKRIDFNSMIKSYI